MSHGHVSLVLHAHLPYVRHPEHDFHLEELWFFEAMHETYLPLIDVARRLERDGIPGTITLSLSPPLMAMMEDDLLMDRLEQHLERLVALSERESSRHGSTSRRYQLADSYRRRFRHLLDLLVETLDRDILGGFAELADAGRFELMTCAGTHALLPIMATDASRRAHVRAAHRAFEQRFGEVPRGMWLPECGYAPEVEPPLREVDVEFSILEDHGLEHADAPPVWGGASPLISDRGLAFFGRDERASTQVWSAQSGYPGHPDYREFYRDVGYERAPEELEPLPMPSGDRYDTGLKYHRVTGDVALDNKELYDPERAEQLVQQHARDFVHRRLDHLRELHKQPAFEDRTPHLTCPYDAELFGHWWFEGPQFLEAVLREAADVSGLRMGSPSLYLEGDRRFQRANPGTSTWGEGGYFDVWLDTSNRWLQPLLHDAEHAMVEWAEAMARDEQRGEFDERRARAIDQFGRELMLAQASDWPFILERDTSTEYARSRLDDHLEALERLDRQLRRHAIDLEWLERRESRTPLRNETDWRDWIER